MKKKSIQFVLFISIFSFFLQVQAFSTPDNVKGMYLYSSTLSTLGVDSVVNTLSGNYVEQVYLLVKGSNGVMIDSTLLANFIAASHNKGIEVHLWYGVSQDAVFFAANPDAVIYHCPNPTLNPPKNDPYPMTGDATSRLNFLYPGYKEYVLGRLTWLLNNFNCDGIYLDNIRYHHLVYSFDQYHIARANALGCDTGRLLQLFINNYATYSGAGWIGLFNQGDADVVKWVNMRKDVLLEFITAVKNLIQQLKPGIELSGSFTPELNNDAMVHYSQDYAVCSPALDRIMPTAFIKDYSQGTAWIKTVTEQTKALVAETNCKITTGYQIVGGTPAVTPAQVSEAITYAMEGGAYGVVGSRFEATVTSDQWGIIKNLYSTIVPVELTSFTADVNSKNVTLKWSTATETNNKGFEVERKSARDKYQTISFINGKGTTGETQKYSFVDKDLADGKYTYRLKQIDYDGSYSYSQEVEVDLAVIKSFSLDQNYPNPFNPVTSIKFNLPVESNVTLKVFNALGELVLDLLNNQLKEAGTHTITLDAANLPSGTYMYRIQAGNNTLSKKMILLK